MALLLQRVLRSGGTLYRDGGGLHLQGLLGPGRQDHRTGHRQGGAHVLPGDLLIVGQGGGLHHHLEVFEAGAIVELDEAEGLHVPDGAGPAGNPDLPAAEVLLIGKNLGDLCAFHGFTSSLYVVVGFHSTLYYKDSCGILQGFVRRNDPRAHFSCFTAGSSPRIPTAPTALRRRHRGPSSPARPTGRKTPRRRERRRAGPGRPARSAPAVP